MNELLINGDIGDYGITATNIRQQLSTMSGDITIKINSRGGSVFEGVEIFNLIREYDRGTVTIIIGSLAASIASYIALAGHKIIVHDNSTFMIHNAWTFTYGNGDELRKTAAILDGLTSIIAKKYISKTGKSKEIIKNEMDKESFYFANEILEFGFCDEIISSDDVITKDEALALSRESFKACCKKAKDTFNPDEFVQAVAKLTKDGVLDVVPNVDDEEKEVALNSAKQRERDLQILEMEINL